MKKIKIKKKVKLYEGPITRRMSRRMQNKQNNIEEKEIEIIKIEDSSNSEIEGKKYLAKRGRKKEKKE